MTDIYFRLNPECFLVLGKQSAVVHNLCTGDAVRLSPGQAQALRSAEMNHPVDPDFELFPKLTEMNWGEFSPRPIFIDKLRPLNVFRERRIWKEPPRLNLAILQLTNDCNLHCTECFHQFCPVCTTATPMDSPILPAGEWRAILDELAFYGVKQVVFTGGEVLLYPDFETVFHQAAASGFQLLVQTNGLLPPPSYLTTAAISIRLNQLEGLEKILENYGADFQNVTLILAGIRPEGLRIPLPPNWKIIQTNPGPTRIIRSGLNAASFDDFFVRRSCDGCLASKITMNARGEILPCLGSPAAPLGNVRNEGFSRVLQRLVEEYWYTPIDRVDPNRKCNGCEYRYLCNACRFLDVERYCAYHPDTGYWSEDEPVLNEPKKLSYDANEVIVPGWRHKLHQRLKQTERTPIK